MPGCAALHLRGLLFSVARLSAAVHLDRAQFAFCAGNRRACLHHPIANGLSYAVVLLEPVDNFPVLLMFLLSRIVVACNGTRRKDTSFDPDQLPRNSG
jgi:hypothetical protein